jgi:hypothetical protein
MSFEKFVIKKSGPKNSNKKQNEFSRKLNLLRILHKFKEKLSDMELAQPYFLDQ